MTVADYAQQYLDNHKQSLSIANLMCSIDGRDDLHKRAARMAACGTYIEGYECTVCGDYHIRKTSLCRDRLCPNCGYVLAHRRAGQTLSALRAQHAITPLKVSMLTLTMQHTRQSDLRQMLQTLTRSYGRLVKQQGSAIIGTARSIEMTYGDNGYHPHIHALIAEPRDGAILRQKQLQRDWQYQLAAGYLPEVKFKEAYSDNGGDEWESAVIEAVKYAIKPSWICRLDTDTLASAADGMQGIRLVATDGAIRHQLARERQRHIDGCANCHCTDPQQLLYMRYTDAGALECTNYLAVLGGGKHAQYL